LRLQKQTVFQNAKISNRVRPKVGDVKDERTSPEHRGDPAAGMPKKIGGESTKMKSGFSVLSKSDHAGQHETRYSFRILDNPEIAMAYSRRDGL